MTEDILPLILSMPHGGFVVPNELLGKLAITDTDIYNECDLWIEELFDFAKMNTAKRQYPDVLARVSTPIARSLVDVNREPDDVDNPDGPVKAHTSYGHTTSASPLSQEEKQTLIERYWKPYHRSLDESLDRFGAAAELFLDCHNMAQIGPSAYGDSGSSRPLICLANLGAPDGSARSPGIPTSCSAAFVRQAAAIAEELFGDISLLEPQPGPAPAVVAINRPYPGGYIIRQYAARRADRGLPPGMMIEFNRGLYVGNQNEHSPIAPPNKERIQLLRQRTFGWVSRVLELE